MKKTITIKQLADTKITFPKMVQADRLKTKGIRTAINAAYLNGVKHLANTHHWTRTNQGFKPKDRLAALTNAIDKFSRLNPAVLKGGQALKDAVIAEAWTAYAKLEIDGQDNAHFTETMIPCQVDGLEADDDSLQGFNNPDFIWAHHAEGLTQ